MGTARIGPVLKYPGSKWRIADWIIRHMPAHDTYLEPFFGSGAVFFRKEPSRLETINDISGDVVNLFRVVRDRPEDLAAAVNMTPWAREEYHASQERDLAELDPIEAARRFLVGCWQSHGSRVDQSNGWRMILQADKGPNTVGYRQWQRVPGRILATASRLKGCQIENRPAVDVIAAHRFERVLIYGDPPYVLGTRSRKQYAAEMTDEEHEELLAVLAEHPGPVLLSAYEHPLYRVLEREHDWARVSTRALADGAKVSTEILWINPVAAEAAGGRLF